LSSLKGPAFKIIEHVGNEAQQKMALSFHSPCLKAPVCWVSFLEIARRYEAQLGEELNPTYQEATKLQGILVQSDG
jgi:hypothetical protein